MPLLVIGLPLVLALVMFAMGTTLTLADFKKKIKKPKALILGSVLQIILLPIVGFVLASMFDLSPENKLGIMMLVGAAGGSTSNLFTFIAKGDLALSLFLTVINSTTFLIFYPLIVNLSIDYFQVTSIAVNLPIIETMGRLFLIIFVPTILGMLLRRYKEAFSLKMEPLIAKLAGVSFFFISIALIVSEIESIKSASSLIILAFSLNVGMMLLGYFVSRMANLIPKEVKTIVIEVGVQNAAMAMMVSLTMLNSRPVALFSAAYALVLLVTSAIFAFFIAKRIK